MLSAKSTASSDLGRTCAPQLWKQLNWHKKEIWERIYSYIYDSYFATTCKFSLWRISETRTHLSFAGCCEPQRKCTQMGRESPHPKSFDRLKAEWPFLCPTAVVVDETPPNPLTDASQTILMCWLRGMQIIHALKRWPHDAQRLRRWKALLLCLTLRCRQCVEIWVRIAAPKILDLLNL